MVYAIVTFVMLGGQTFNVWSEMPGVKEIKQGSSSRFVDEETNRPLQYFPSWIKLTSSLAGYKNLFKEDETEYLPYLADVTEDLPGSVQGKFPPQTWTGCKLLAKKHNGYMEFFHEPSGKTLRIAMNSNIYKPTV